MTARDEKHMADEATKDPVEDGGLDIPWRLKAALQNPGDAEASIGETAGGDLPADLAKTEDGSHDLAIVDGERPDEKATGTAADKALGMARGAAGTLKAGAFAIRDVHNASRQSAGARAQARAVQDALEGDRRMLSHRQEIEASFDEILAAQTETAERNRSLIESVRRKAEGVAEEHSALVADLDELKAANASAIRPYKHLVETSKDELDDCKRVLIEAKRAVKSAESQLQEAKERREAAYTSASRSFDNSRARQLRVEQELKKLQQDGGAAAAVSRLQADNAATVENVRSAKAAVEKASRDGQAAVDNAQTHFWTQSQSLQSAQAKYDAALAKHHAHKTEHDKMADDAAAQEKELQERIEDKKRSLDALRAEMDDAQRALEEAQGLIDEAKLIRSTPEETERLEQSIAAQQADLDEANCEVEHLAVTEKQLRQATRGSRVALIAAAVVVLIVVAVIAASCTAK